MKRITPQVTAEHKLNNFSRHLNSIFINTILPTTNFNSFLNQLQVTNYCRRDNVEVLQTRLGSKTENYLLTRCHQSLCRYEGHTSKDWLHNDTARSS